MADMDPGLVPTDASGSDRAPRGLNLGMVPFFLAVWVCTASLQQCGVGCCQQQSGLQWASKVCLFIEYNGPDNLLRRWLEPTSGRGVLRHFSHNFCLQGRNQLFTPVGCLFVSAAWFFLLATLGMATDESNSTTLSSHGG